LLLRRLLAEHPPIARPELIAIQSCTAPRTPVSVYCRAAAAIQRAVLPDQSTCEACLTEMADPDARRYAIRSSPALNAGPLYDHSVAAFDRVTTGMADFPSATCAEQNTSSLKIDDSTPVDRMCDLRPSSASAKDQSTSTATNLRWRVR